MCFPEQGLGGDRGPGQQHLEVLAGDDLGGKSPLNGSLGIPSREPPDRCEGARPHAESGNKLGELPGRFLLNKEHCYDRYRWRT